MCYFPIQSHPYINTCILYQFFVVPCCKNATTKVVNHELDTVNEILRFQMLGGQPDLYLGDVMTPFPRRSLTEYSLESAAKRVPAQLSASSIAKFLKCKPFKYSESAICNTQTLNDGPHKAIHGQLVLLPSSII